MDNILVIGDVVICNFTTQRYEVIRTTKTHAILKKKDNYSDTTIKARRIGEKFMPYHEYEFWMYNSVRYFTKEKP